MRARRSFFQGAASLFIRCIQDVKLDGKLNSSKKGQGCSKAIPAGQVFRRLILQRKLQKVVIRYGCLRKSDGRLFCAPGGRTFYRVKVPTPPGSGKGIAEQQGFGCHEGV